MSDFILLGTDTDVGKTTFALLWLAAFADYEYWKPAETGPSDSESIRALIPGAKVHAPRLRLDEPVAPPLAAQRAGVAIPPARDLAAARPTSTQPLLIETFGSPFSPLSERESQVALIQALGVPSILVSSSTLGCIGRTEQC